MKKIILTGFEPFGPYAFNPVQESTRYFDGQTIGSTKVVGIVLQCTYRGAFETLSKAIDELQPSAILSTGVASSVKGIRFETTGRNLMYGKYPDAYGFEPKGVPILERGQEFINAHSDNAKIANRVHGKGIPTEMSADAEGFICNSLLYLTSDYIQKNRLVMSNVFIHTPWTENFRGRVTLDPSKLLIPQEALHTAIEEIIKDLNDQ